MTRAWFSLYGKRGWSHCGCSPANNIISVLSFSAAKNLADYWIRRHSCGVPLFVRFSIVVLACMLIII